MHSLALSLITEWTSGRLYGEDCLVSLITHDTRSEMANALYVCLRGERFDGHQFCKEAREKGATALLVEQLQTTVSLRQVVVKNTQVALAQIAAAMQRRRITRLFAITGSNGKTTVKSMLFSILRHWGQQQQRTVYMNPGNYNNEIGMPVSVIRAPEAADDAIYEMGAGKPDDIAYLTGIIQPSIALVNTIAPAHLERLSHLLGVARTKGAIYSALTDDGVAVINADDAFGQWFMQTHVPPQCRVLRFAITASAEIRARSICVDTEYSQFHLITPLGCISVKIPLLGLHHVRNALAAAAMAYAANVSLAAIAQGLAEVEPSPGRQQVYTLKNGVTLIDDSYNANIGSVQAAIDVLSKRAPAWLVLGDMHELGVKGSQWHAYVGQLVRQAGIERLYTLGSLSQTAAQAFGQGAVACIDGHDHLIAQLQSDLDAYGKTDSSSQSVLTILIKGSRASAMNRIVAALLASDGGKIDVA